jgi:hypothetical protein
MAGVRTGPAVSIARRFRPGLSGAGRGAKTTLRCGRNHKEMESKIRVTFIGALICEFEMDDVSLRQDPWLEARRYILYKFTIAESACSARSEV